MGCRVPREACSGSTCASSPGPEASPWSLKRNQEDRRRGLRPAYYLALVPSHRTDLQAKAVELEYGAFRNAKMVNLYKASVLKKVGLGQGGQQAVHAHSLRTGQGRLSCSEATSQPLAWSL